MRAWRQIGEKEVIPPRSELPRAVVILVPHMTPGTGLFLAVSRRENESDFGLPGGKVEDNESLLEAAERELKEETGITARGLVRIPFVATDGEFLCYAFLMPRLNEEPRECEPGIFVRWFPRERLEEGCFGDYNRQLFASLGQ